MNEDEKLIKQLRRGSSQAYEEVYRRYYRMAVSIVNKLGGNPEDVQDAFQEALFVLVKKVREPDFQLTGKLSTYLYALIRNLYLKRNRKHKKEIPVEQEKLPYLEKIQEAGMSKKEEEALVRIVIEKLEQLEDDCRDLLKYSFFQQLSHAEIAELMDYSPKFVRVKKFRCLEYLRNLLRETEAFKSR